MKAKNKLCLFSTYTNPKSLFFISEVILENMKDDGQTNWKPKEIFNSVIQEKMFPICLFHSFEVFFKTSRICIFKIAILIALGYKIPNIFIFLVHFKQLAR